MSVSVFWYNFLIRTLPEGSIPDNPPIQTFTMVTQRGIWESRWTQNFSLGTSIVFCPENTVPVSPVGVIAVLVGIPLYQSHLNRV